mmetsp:Transcript_162838/g.395582  ORF Transcript_162838/g.395582 Transcript_162838/m.395582 type:complete len:439 (+) Transcript_162838:657-1973(+)
MQRHGRNGRRQHAQSLVRQDGKQHREVAVDAAFADQLPRLPKQGLVVDDGVPAQHPQEVGLFVLRERDILQKVDEVLGPYHRELVVRDLFGNPVEVEELLRGLPHEAAHRAPGLRPPAAGLPDRERGAVDAGVPRPKVGDAREQDGAVEEARGARGHHVRGDGAAALARAHERDARGVAAEGADVLLHPAQGGLLVVQPQVLRDARPRQADPAEDAQAPAEGDEDRGVLGRARDAVALAVVLAARAVLVDAAVEINDYRHVLVSALGHPHVQGQAIFALLSAFCVGPDANLSEDRGVVDHGSPRLLRLRDLEAPRLLRVGDAQEGVVALRPDAHDRAQLRVRHGPQRELSDGVAHHVVIHRKALPLHELSRILLLLLLLRRGLRLRLYLRLLDRLLSLLGRARQRLVAKPGARPSGPALYPQGGAVLRGALHGVPGIR